MEKTNVNPDERIVNAHEHQQNVVCINQFSTITVGEINSLCLCQPLVNFGVLKIDLIADYHEMVEPFVESFVSFFKDKCTVVMIQHVGFNSAKISLVYSSSATRLFYYLHKFESSDKGCKLYF